MSRRQTMKKAPLTGSQVEALRIVAGREPKATTTSSRNHAPRAGQGGCIASGSAHRLAALGLIEGKAGPGLRYWYHVTEAGRDLLGVRSAS